MSDYSANFLISRSDKCISDMLDAINNSRSLHVSPNEQEICFLYVEDAVDEIIYAIESKNLRTFQEIYTYTVMGKEVFQLEEIPIKIAQILKKPCPTIIQYSIKANESWRNWFELIFE